MILLGSFICFFMKNKSKVFLFHGWQDSCDSNFFPWLKNELVKLGIQVYAHDFPVYTEWKQSFEKIYLPLLDSNDILVSHSLGGAFLSRYLTENRLQTLHNIFVAPPHYDLNQDPLMNFFSVSFDYEKIRNSSNNLTIIGSNNDRWLSENEMRDFAQVLKGEFVFLPDRAHFNDLVFPELLGIIKEYYL